MGTNWLTFQSRLHRRIFRAPQLLLLPLLVPMLSGCGGVSWGTIPVALTAGNSGSTSTTNTDSSGSTTGTLRLQVTSATIYVNRATTFVASGGESPYSYSVISGDGSVDSSTGEFTAPSASGTTTVRVTDHAGQTAVGTVTIMDLPVMSLDVSPGNSTLTTGQSVTFSVSGGSGSYTLTLVSGGGSVSGLTYQAPSTATTASIRVSDSFGNSVNLTVTVNAIRTVDIFRVYHSPSGDHMMTHDSQEGASLGYVNEGRRFGLYADSTVSSTTALYRCLNSTGGSHHFASFYSHCEGRTNEGTLGYVSTVQSPSSLIPLYRFVNLGNGDRLVTTDWNEAVSARYTYEGLLGYVLP